MEYGAAKWCLSLTQHGTFTVNEAKVKYMFHIHVLSVSLASTMVYSRYHMLIVILLGNKKKRF